MAFSAQFHITDFVNYKHFSFQNDFSKWHHEDIPAQDKILLYYQTQFSIKKLHLELLEIDNLGFSGAPISEYSVF